MSGRPLETVLWTPGGSTGLFRLVHLPVPVDGRTEAAWRFRHLVTPHGRYISKNYPDHITGALVVSGSIPWGAETEELLERARKCSESLGESIREAMADPSPDLVSLARILSVQPFPPEFESDPLYEYRMFLLETAAYHRDNEASGDFEFLKNHPTLRPVSPVDMEELKTQALADFKKEHGDE